MLFICDSLLHPAAREKRQNASVILARCGSVLVQPADESAEFTEDCHVSGGKDHRESSPAPLARGVVGHLLLLQTCIAVDYTRRCYADLCRLCV